MQIVTFGHPALLVTCPAVTEFGQRIADLAAKMIAVCRGTDTGIGLAAPQVALADRFFVMQSDPESGDQVYITVVNPRILEGADVYLDFEGCLSLPGFVGEVPRKRDILVSYQDAHGQTMERPFHGLAARLFQHEADHLDGVLFPTRAKSLYRTKANSTNAAD